MDYVFAIFAFVSANVFTIAAVWPVPGLSVQAAVIMCNCFVVVWMFPFFIGYGARFLACRLVIPLGLSLPRGITGTLLSAFNVPTHFLAAFLVEYDNMPKHHLSAFTVEFDTVHTFNLSAYNVESDNVPSNYLSVFNVESDNVPNNNLSAFYVESDIGSTYNLSAYSVESDNVHSNSNLFTSRARPFYVFACMQDVQSFLSMSATTYSTTCSSERASPSGRALRVDAAPGLVQLSLRLLRVPDRAVVAARVDGGVVEPQSQSQQPVGHGHEVTPCVQFDEVDPCRVINGLDGGRHVLRPEWLFNRQHVLRPEPRL